MTSKTKANSDSKSKLTSFTFRKVLCVLVVLCFNLIESVPTFGNEFVHIKVRILDEKESHGPPLHVHPHPHHIVHHPPVHKVVHHYHHRKRRPAKKKNVVKHSDLLENILLTELKKPVENDHYKYLQHAEDIAKNIDTIIVKPEKPKTHVDTYSVIEEAKPIKEITETYKIIESKAPHFEAHTEGYSYKPKGHIETYKVIDSLLDDYHTNFKEPETSFSPPKKQLVKTVKIIDSHEPDFAEDQSHYGYHSQRHDVVKDFTTQKDYVSDGGYNYGSKTHVDTVKIVQTKAPHQHKYSVNFNKRPYTSDTVEIIKTHEPSKPKNYYNRHRHRHHRFKYEDQHYNDEEPSSAGGYDNTYVKPYSSGYDYRPYRDSYRKIPEEPYPPEPEEHIPSDYNQRQHSSSVHQNTLYDDDDAESLDNNDVENMQDSYLPPPLPETLPGLQESSYDNGYKAAETYTGTDSYNAPHVQGVGSNGYDYPSPFI